MINPNRFLGGVLLIAGTTIGAGMLAMPIVTGFAGFFPSLLVLGSCWLFMLITGFLFLEVNLAMEGEVNLITMAQRTLGKWGKILSWGVYLLLLYSLTAAYIAGSAPIFLESLQFFFGLSIPSWAGPLPLLLFFGLFVYLGTLATDYINRLLMMGLLLGYVLLIMLVPSHIQWNLFTHIDYPAMLLAFPVVITSFGYHIIIPTLTTYMAHDKKKLRLAVLIGSLIPLIFYLLWEFLVLGSVPLTGSVSLAAAAKNGVSATFPLRHILTSPWIGLGAQMFSFFAVVTSFMGVSLSLSDFLTDGLRIKKTGFGRLLACLMTFTPPLLFVYSYPRGFLIALQYAGICVAILLGILPALMSWHLPNHPFFKSIKGRALLIGVMLFATAIIILDIAEETGVLHKLTEKYFYVSTHD